MREAVVRLSDAELAALGFGDLVAHCRDAGVRNLEMLEDDGYSCVPQVTLESKLDEDLLTDLDCVDGWELVADREGTYVYLLELSATELPEGVTDDHGELVGTCELTVEDRGLMLSILGTQETIRDMLANYESVGVVPDLCKLGDYEGEETTLDALTDRQREALLTAYEMGFYDVPRSASTAEVAAELDVDAATLSEHLQRAERNVLGQELSG